jgi:hypothetical protein
VHAGGARRRARGQRLLYWFRTPPGVRVGRAPIDEEAIRLLEQHNPDVEFDWMRILKEPAKEVREGFESRQGRDAEGRQGRERRDRREAPRAQPPTERARAGEDPARDRGEMAVEPTADAADLHVHEPAANASSTRADSDAMDSANGESEFADSAEAIDSTESADSDRASASYQRLGAEGLGRLRARYAEVMARIAEQPVDEEARERLKSRAERLNPDGWVTADEVSAALEQYETVFEELRALVLVGRDPHRRRRRR